MTTVTDVTDALEEGFRELDAWLDRDREELASRPDRPDAWSPLEHLEHVDLANHFLLLTIAKGCRTARRRAQREPVPPGESDLALLAPVAVPGAFDWPPPRHMVPTGRREPAEIRRGLEDEREQCRELLAGIPHGEGRLYAIRMSVGGLGRLDMYQWLYFLAQHMRYHLRLLEARRGR